MTSEEFWEKNRLNVWSYEDDVLSDSECNLLLEDAKKVTSGIDEGINSLKEDIRNKLNR